MAHGVRRLFDFVLVGLLVESGGRLQHDTVLNSKIGQRFLRAVFQSQLHQHVIAFRLNRRCIDDAVGQCAGDFESTIVCASPLQFFQRDLLIVEISRNVGVSQVGQAEVRPERLGHVDDDKVVLGPRSEHADFGFALRPDGSFEEPDPRMTSAGPGNDEE